MSKYDSIVEFIEDNENTTAPVISQRLGINKPTVAMYLSQAVKNGDIERVSRGVYRSVPMSYNDLKEVLNGEIDTNALLKLDLARAERTIALQKEVIARLERNIEQYQEQVGLYKQLDAKQRVIISQLETTVSQLRTKLGQALNELAAVKTDKTLRKASIPLAA